MRSLQESCWNISVARSQGLCFSLQDFPRKVPLKSASILEVTQSLLEFQIPCSVEQTSAVTPGYFTSLKRKGTPFKLSLSQVFNEKPPCKFRYS